MTVQDQQAASREPTPTDPHQPRRAAALLEDLHVGAVIQGDHRVVTGRRVRLLGTVHGDLLVEDGARLDLFGTVNGDVYAVGRANVYDGATIAGGLSGDGVRDRRSGPPVHRSRWL